MCTHSLKAAINFVCICIFASLCYADMSGFDQLDIVHEPSKALSGISCISICSHTHANWRFCFHFVGALQGNEKIHAFYWFGNPTVFFLAFSLIWVLQLFSPGRPTKTLTAPVIHVFRNSFFAHGLVIFGQNLIFNFNILTQSPWLLCRGSPGKLESSFYCSGVCGQSAGLHADGMNAWITCMHHAPIQSQAPCMCVYMQSESSVRQELLLART